MRLLRPFWLCFLSALALSGQHEPKVPGGPGVLRCGLQSFWFLVDLANPKATPELTTWGKGSGAPLTQQWRLPGPALPLPPLRELRP